MVCFPLLPQGIPTTARLLPEGVSVAWDTVSKGVNPLTGP